MSTEQEWHTHFQGFAKLLFERLKPDLAMLLIEVNRNNPDAIEKAEHIIQGVIAEAQYDFADHLIKHLHGSNLDEIKDMGLARFLEEYGQEIGNERVPDMTAWPEQKE